jgi:rhodanese-related sulfurtransferase
MHPWSTEMVKQVEAKTLKSWLSDGREIALVDVREAGQFGEAHLFFAVPLPYSRLEIGLGPLLPNSAVRLVFCDGADGIAERAATRAKALGYSNVHVLSGGIEDWRRAGYTLYAGVNVPSKTFGELIEHSRHTPRVTAQDVDRMRKAGENFVIVDGRTLAEYRRMNIPGGVCCPNGELALRIGDIAPDPDTKIVVNCAGRTRSIIGAQTLIDLGIPNPIFALENGTQGWFLAGLKLEHGADRRYPERPAAARTADLAARALRLAAAHGATVVEPAAAASWLADTSRTTYLLDVRTPEEVAARSVPGFVHAPGGQLIQAIDQWIGVRGARLVLMDEEGVRAPVVAAWLRQLGHEACVLDGGIAAAARFRWQRPQAPAAHLPPLAPIAVSEAGSAVRAGSAAVIDLRPSMTYRKGHIAGAIWSTRPRIAAAVADRRRTIVLVADDEEAAQLAALDLAEAGFADVRILEGGYAAWCRAGLPTEATPDRPADADCIDFLFFTAARHDGDAAAARAYLTWEIGLVGQLDAQERGAFRIRNATSP